MYHGKRSGGRRHLQAGPKLHCQESQHRRSELSPSPSVPTSLVLGDQSLHCVGYQPETLGADEMSQSSIEGKCFATSAEFLLDLEVRYAPSQVQPPQTPAPDQHRQSLTDILRDADSTPARPALRRRSRRHVELDGLFSRKPKSTIIVK